MVGRVAGKEWPHKGIYCHNVLPIKRLDVRKKGAFAVKYFDIRPAVSWSEFTRNAELTGRIYDVGMEREAEGDWAYINPATGYGIFEDGGGSFVFLETVDQGSEALIVDMHCGLKGETVSEMAQFIAAFVAEFGLSKTPMEDA